ncbi:hypothetical protein E8D34_13795 [Nocardioides sp. GY 10113]|uniref:hypothetical protein n=1 Tax=Nocardioides sp. GY 10113 TaxID=2569761 RepID=UPI0010A9055F|nr:hypothetical protein [Nocardioides sp. GY 10113]TIC85136.1 hypothetical protein E8D34_13795 [Nocardioides sp. GY 10113]
MRPLRTTTGIAPLAVALLATALGTATPALGAQAANPASAAPAAVRATTCVQQVIDYAPGATGKRTPRKAARPFLEKGERMVVVRNERYPRRARVRVFDAEGERVGTIKVRRPRGWLVETVTRCG